VKLEIKILGVNNNAYDNLKANLEEALRIANVPHEMVSVSDIPQIIEHNVSSVPSLLIEKQLVYEKGEIPTVEELVKKINELTSVKKLSWSYNILVPIDFSDTSKNALQYACNLASDINGQVKIVHIDQPLIDPSAPTLIEPVENHIQEKTKALGQFVESVQVATSRKMPPISSEVIMGFASEEIIRISEEEDFDLIVLGSTGEGGIFKSFFGSVSLRVTKDASCSVILVPDGTDYKPLRKIMYASNLLSVKETAVSDVCDLAKVFGSTVDFVHVSDDEKKGKDLKQKIYDLLFNENAPKFVVNIALMKSNNIVEGLEKYIKENGVDLAAFATKHRSILDRITHRSVTRKMAVQSRIPIMVLKTN
jgi:nucleotide-binding universal stress UspA family protein